MLKFNCIVIFVYDENYTYYQLKNATSAISSMINPLGNVTFGRLPIVKRFMKGVFECRPVFPRLSVFWDVNILFDFFRSLPKPEDLSLKILGQKLATLMAIVSGGQRVQTIHQIHIDDIIFHNEKVLIPITSVIKQTRPSNHMPPLVFKDFEESTLCVVRHLKLY